jgi:hypothetical protein
LFLLSSASFWLKRSCPRPQLGVKSFHDPWIAELERTLMESCWRFTALV